jgi:hypothetical protein
MVRKAAEIADRIDPGDAGRRGASGQTVVAQKTLSFLASFCQNLCM